MSTAGSSRNLFEALEAAARARPNHVATRSRRGGAWEWTSWGEWYEASRAIAVALAERGVERGDRVALFSKNREEWAHTDFGIFGAGAVTVPIYPTSTHEQVAHILKSSGSKIAVVEGQRQLEALALALDSAPSVSQVIVMDTASSIAGRDGHLGTRRAPVTPYVELVRAGREHLSTHAEDFLAARRTEPEDLATIVYTSGTTGEPRGAMLTHASFLTEVTDLLDAFHIEPEDEQLLVLPLAHILARILMVAQVISGSRLAFGTDPHRLVDDLGEVEPTFFAAVPRLFEKAYNVANQSAMAQSPLKKALWSWAIDAGKNASRATQRGKALKGISAARARYADELVLKRVRRTFGTRLRFAISGGAPLSAELAEWFHACGILVLEGYGLTEATGASHVNREDRYAFGSVGLPLRSVETRIGTDGEVLLRGPTIMKGYFGEEEATRAAIDEDGWFHTGDIGKIAANGFLTIVDRKKDAIVTAGGSNVAPQNIEQMLSASPWVAHAVVFGDKQPYLVALVTLDLRACQRWATERKRPTDIQSLSRDPELLALIQLDVDATNHRLSSYETIKRFAVLGTELTQERGELTDTLKVRRRVIEKHYKSTIDSLYDR